MAACQRCVVGLLVAAVCGAAASATERPAADNGTELGGLLGRDTMEGPAGAPTSVPGTAEYDPQPNTGDSTSAYPGTGDSTSADPGTGDSTSADPGTGDSTSADPGTGDSTSADPGTAEYSADPGTGDSTSAYPGTGDSTSAYPGTGDSTSAYPGTGDSTSAYPGTGDSTSAYPGTGDSTSADPGTGDSTSADPGTGDSTSADPGTGDSTSADPGTGDSTSADPGTGDSTSAYPGTGDSTSAYPGTGDSTSAYPGTGDSTSAYPGTGDSTSADPGTGDSTSADPGTGDSTSADPGTGDSTSADPGTGDSTSADPGTGDSTSADPGTGDSTSADPGTGDSTSADPGTGDSTSADPGTGDSTSADPGTGDSTSADPGTGDSTSADPGTGDSTSADPGTGDSTSADPGTGDSTSADPGTGDSTSADPGTGDSTSAEPVPWDPRSEAPGDLTSMSSPPVPELLQPRSIRPLETPISSLCICDLLVDECDVNCCCDPDCRAADFSVFSECSVPVVTGDSDLCTREAVRYSISSSKVPQRVTEIVEVINPNIFCIQATNYQPALSFITPDDPTEANFDSLLEEFGGIDFNIGSDIQSTVGSAEARKSSKYEYGSPLLTQDSYLKLPAPLGTSECTDSNPVGFLESQDFTCSRNIEIENCSIPVLTLGTYANFEVLTVPNLQNTINVSLQAIAIRSIDGAVFRGNVSDYIPSYDNTTGVCNHVVLGNGTAPAPISGNPGYVFGLPVVAGFRLPQSGIIQSTNRFGQLTLLKSSNDQNCLAEEGSRTPVLFGYNMMSGCKLRVHYTSDGFCKFAGAAILNVLQGQQVPTYVAQFGNSQPENILDWVPINVITTDQAEVQGSCSIPVSLNLEIRWTKFGSLKNPQAQIVSVEKNIAYSSFPNNLEGTRFVQIASSVTFLDLSQPASPGYKARPTIDAKLPFDFFHPFL
ncbi:tectonic-1 isoform X2 [Dendrobates tinctorius]|uniref:tectonic-1 isoform X2 n=1 Tax=Dendrobates tinctorius TaxID=92724 RepID=UPI003CC9B45F